LGRNEEYLQGHHWVSNPLRDFNLEGNLLGVEEDLGWGQKDLDKNKDEEGGTGSVEPGREPPTRQVHKREQVGWAEGDRKER
jgi:hypothetical protein